tara:strand:- start:9578 stop:9925 length:348 start_codon:yes stop_codon:yes gene_type:complete
MFNELPRDIKEMIFKMNRVETSREINKNKEKYHDVLNHIRDIVGTTYSDFYDVDEAEDNIINDWSFSMAMLQCITTENIDYHVDCMMEEAYDEHLDYLTYEEETYLYNNHISYSL